MEQALFGSPPELIGLMSIKVVYLEPQIKVQLSVSLNVAVQDLLLGVALHMRELNMGWVFSHSPAMVNLRIVLL